MAEEVDMIGVVDDGDDGHVGVDDGGDGHDGGCG